MTVTNVLSPKFDLDTFALTEVAFGDTVLSIPAGSKFFHTEVPMTFNGETFNVIIEVALDDVTRKLTARYFSVDPNTSLPPSVLAGFLPPEDDTGRGLGHVGYTVSPVAGLSTGTEIRNVATIVFDFNPPITTDQIDPEDASHGIDLNKQALITIDAVGPASQVAALGSITNTSSFTVNWLGSDDNGGSGVRSHDIFVSIDGGSYQPWKKATKDISDIFVGAFGHAYSFYSVATDNVGHVESAPLIADATTSLVSPDTVPPKVANTFIQNGLTERSFVDRVQFDFSEETNIATLISSGAITNAVTLTNLGVNAPADADQAVPLTPDQFHHEFDAISGRCASPGHWTALPTAIRA